MKEKLLKIGFTKNEAIIFEALVQYGELSASELSKKVSIDRSVTYNILDNLILKGYISYITRDGKRIFLVKKPESLLVPLDEKVEIASELIKTIQKRQKITKQHTDVSIHEGKNALKLLDSELLNAKEAYALNVIGKAYEIIPYHMEQLSKKASKQVKAKIIVSSEQGLKIPLNKESRVKIKIMPKKYWNNAPIVIHNDIVLITVFDIDKPFSIRIQNKTIAEAFKKDFELVWDLIK